MGFALRMMIFVLVFNLGVGIMTSLLGAGAYLNPLDTGGIDTINDMSTQFGATSGVPVEETNLWYRFLDFVSLTIFNKLKVFLNSTIFAVPALLTNIGLLDETIRPYFNALISIIFIMGMIDLFTSKDPMER